MKTNILFITLISISALVRAQVNFGVKAGYNLSSVKFADKTLDSKSFFYAGGLVEYPLSPKIALQGELLYTQIGGKMSEPIHIDGTQVINFENTQYDIQLSQIQIPISVKYSFIPQLSASVGMNVAFNVSSKVKTTFLGNDFYDSAGIKTVNLYPFLGAEFKFNKNFFADARYNFNCIEMNKNNDRSVKAGFLQAGVGYLFK